MFIYHTWLHNFIFLFLSSLDFLCSAKSFVGLVRYLFSLPEVKKNQLAFLSQHICQDPLENFFGSQRQRGGTSDNPSAQEYYRNTQALVNLFCRGPVKGNCRGSQDVNRDIDSENTLPPKRHASRKKLTYIPHI